MAHCEKRTVFLLVLPVVTTVVTLCFSIVQGTELIFVSDAFNFYMPEPWAIWLFRYALWSATFLGIFYVKYILFPDGIRWIAYVNIFEFFLAQWTGFTNYEGFDLETYRSSWMPYVHGAASTIAFIQLVIETVVLWWPSCKFACVYVVVLAIYFTLFVAAQLEILPDTGIPLIRRHIEIPSEYLILFSHFFIAWKRYPILKAEGFESIPCLCCCPWLGKSRNFQALE